MEIIEFKNLDDWAEENNIGLKSFLLRSSLDINDYFKNYGYGKYLMEKFDISQNDPFYISKSFQFLHPERNEYVKVNGIVYCRPKNSYSDFFMILATYDDDFKKKNKSVICSCGNDTFVLYFGDGGVRGGCTNCGINSWIWC